MSRKPAATFYVLLDEHEEMEQVFNSHQRALLSKDVETALAMLSMFANSLHRHIGHEEQNVFPLYAAKGAETPGGTLQIFQAEHRKLREWVDRLTRDTEALYNSADILGSVIRLFDDEAMFKGLLSHHTVRESNLLVPRLEERTTLQERQRALQRT